MGQLAENTVLRSQRVYKTRWISGFVLISGVTMAGACLFIILATLLAGKSSPIMQVIVTVWLGITAAFFLWYPLHMFSRSLTRYIFTPEALIERSLFRKQVMPWRDVTDYSVVAGDAGEPLSHIIFHLVDGQTKQLPLDLIPEGRVETLLSAYVPLIAEHGLERPRQAGSSKSELRKSTRKEAISDWATLCFNILFGGICITVSVFLMLGRMEYQLIISDPVEVTATVIELDVDEEDASLTFEFTDDQGHVVRSSRSVEVSTAKTLAVGSEVTVKHLRGSPTKVRLKKGDLDHQEWLYVFVSFPLGWLCIWGCFRLLRSIFGPKTKSASWSVQSNYDEAIISYSPAYMETSVAMIPEQHVGAAVFLRLNSKENSNQFVDQMSTFSPSSHELNGNNIQCENIAGIFLCMGPVAMSRFVSRLGEPAKTRAEYVVLDMADSVEVSRWAVRNDPRHRDMDELFSDEVVRFCCRNNTVGPVQPGELTYVFDRFIMQMIKALCEDQTPAGLYDVSICQILNLSPKDLDARIMLSLQMNRLRIFVQLRGVNQASVAEYQFGQWRRTPEMPVPLSMRNFKWLKYVLALPYGPWLILPVLPYLIYWAMELPCKWYRHFQLNKARAALLQSSSI